MYSDILLLLLFVSVINVIYWLNSGCACEFYPNEGNIYAVKLYLKCRYLYIFYYYYYDYYSEPVFKKTLYLTYNERYFNVL